MAIATGTAIAIGAGVSAAGAIGGSAIAAHAQSNATKAAAKTESDAAANSLAFNQRQYDTTLANEKPYWSVGNQAANQLSSGLADGSLTQAWNTPFSFSGVDLKNDPAYQFDLQQGQQAVQRSAAAQGGLVSGGAMKDLNDYTQGYASNQFQQSYANALAAYQQSYNIFENNQANKFNRLSSVAGLGQNAATQTATSGNAAAGTNAAVNSNTANSIANLTTAQGNASGAATISAFNGIGNAVNTAANYFANTSGSSYSKGSSTGGVFDSNGNYLGE